MPDTKAVNQQAKAFSAESYTRWRAILGQMARMSDATFGAI